MKEGRNLVDDTYSVGCVLDAGRRVLVLLGAEDLLHVAGRRAGLLGLLYIGLGWDAIPNPIDLIVIRLIKKLESIVSGKGEEERAREEKRRRESRREEISVQLKVGSERGIFWVSCPDLTSSPNPKTKGLTPPRHSRWVESESESGGEPKGSGGRRAGGLI
jgi:hypothetical protein